MSREKGVLDLIDSFSKLNVGKLYVAGEGNEKENILEFIKQNKLQERIELLGFLKKDEVIDTTRKCSFIVVPSIGYENCPYSIIETMAIGKPVIGANVAGIPELVKDGHTGFIYEKIDELSEKMKILVKVKRLVWISSCELGECLWWQLSWFDFFCYDKDTITERNLREKEII